MQKRSKLDEEQIEINSNQAAVAVHKEKQAKARNDVKEFWHSQLVTTQDQKLKEKDAADVFKKKIAVWIIRTA